MRVLTFCETFLLGSYMFTLLVLKLGFTEEAKLSIDAENMFLWSPQAKKKKKFFNI